MKMETWPQKGTGIFLCGPPLSDDELEQLLPGSRQRQRDLDQLVRDVRAFGPFFIFRSALPPDLR